jgi:hypothetical protein
MFICLHKILVYAIKLNGYDAIYINYFELKTNFHASPK